MATFEAYPMLFSWYGAPDKEDAHVYQVIKDSVHTQTQRTCGGSISLYMCLMSLYTGDACTMHGLSNYLIKGPLTWLRTRPI